MVKLKEKLIKLGYKPYHDDHYIKEVGNIDILVKMVDLKFTQIYRMCIYNHMRYINNQQDIDSLQQALNVMKKDLEMLNND